MILFLVFALSGCTTIKALGECDNIKQCQADGVFG